MVSFDAGRLVKCLCANRTSIAEVLFVLFIKQIKRNSNLYLKTCPFIHSRPTKQQYKSLQIIWWCWWWCWCWWWWFGGSVAILNFLAVTSIFKQLGCWCWCPVFSRRPQKNSIFKTVNVKAGKQTDSSTAVNGCHHQIFFGLLHQTKKKRRRRKVAAVLVGHFSEFSVSLSFSFLGLPQLWVTVWFTFRPVFALSGRKSTAADRLRLRRCLLLKLTLCCCCCCCWLFT